MTIHRRASVRVWSDQKFRGLSPLACSGQALWLYLLIGDLSLAWPGLIPHGLATISERRRWDLEGTRCAWEEIEALELALADWAGPLIWLPNAVYHNEPDNPNQVKAWGRCVEFIPECRLLNEAVENLLVYLEGRCHAAGSTAFMEAFLEGLSEAGHGALKRSVNRSRNGSGNGSANQKQ